MEEVDERVKNIKIHVDGKGAEIQRVLFALGAKWVNGNTEVYMPQKPFLIITDDGFLFQGDDKSLFSQYKYKEVSADEVLSWTPKNPCHCPSGPRGVSESESIVRHLTKLADELLNFARLHPEAYDELCEASVQIIEAKRRIAKKETQRTRAQKQD